MNGAADSDVKIFIDALGAARAWASRRITIIAPPTVQGNKKIEFVALES
jgi:hypothetical protein